jgi:hypothetical protein
MLQISEKYLFSVRRKTCNTTIFYENATTQNSLLNSQMQQEFSVRYMMDSLLGSKTQQPKDHRRAWTQFFQMIQKRKQRDKWLQD